MTAQVKDAAANLLVVWNTLQAKLSSAVNPGELLMSPEEVSAYTGVSVPSLAMMRYRHMGPDYSKPSPRAVMYRKRDVDAWIAAGNVQVVNPTDPHVEISERVPQDGAGDMPSALGYVKR